METEYKIIGGDGVEYGPASLDEIESWIRDGRVSRSTQVWRSDLLRWNPAERFQELQLELARLHATVPEAALPQEERSAGFWARLGAQVLDRLIIFPIFLLAWMPVADWQHWQRLPPNLPAVINDETTTKYGAELSAWANRGMMVYLPVFMLYDVLLNGAFGGTVGKVVIGARLRTKDGARISYSRAMVRWWAARLSEFLLYTGFLLIALRHDKRGLHDLIAGTKVVYVR